MGNDQKDLDIKVRVSKTGDGAEEAATGLNKLTTATGEHAKASEKMAEASKESEKGFAGVNLETGESCRIINEIPNNAIPGLVEGLRGLTSPLGAFGLALGVFAEAKAKLDEWDKQMEETASRLRRALRQHGRGHGQCQPQDCRLRPGSRGRPASNRRGATPCKRINRSRHRSHPPSGRGANCHY